MSHLLNASSITQSCVMFKGEDKTVQDMVPAYKWTHKNSLYNTMR